MSYLTKCLPQGGAKASGNVMPSDQTEVAIFTFRKIYKSFELLHLAQHGYFWLIHKNVECTRNIILITAFPQIHHRLIIISNVQHKSLQKLARRKILPPVPNSLPKSFLFSISNLFLQLCMSHIPVTPSIQG